MVGFEEVGEGLFDEDGQVDGGSGHDLQELPYLVDVVMHEGDLRKAQIPFQLIPICLNFLFLVVHYYFHLLQIALGVKLTISLYDLLPLP